MKLEVELRDTPGELGRLLETVANHGGNVEGVVHRRGEAHGEWVPVELNITIPPDGAERLVEDLRDSVRVLRWEGRTASHPLSFLLVGHVFQANIAEVTDALFEAGCRVHEVQADIRDRDDVSAVYLDATARDGAARAAALERVGELAREKDLELVRDLRGDAP